VSVNLAVQEQRFRKKEAGNLSAGREVQPEEGAPLSGGKGGKTVMDAVALLVQSRKRGEGGGWWVVLWACTVWKKESEKLKKLLCSQWAKELKKLVRAQKGKSELNRTTLVVGERIWRT